MALTSAEDVIAAGVVDEMIRGAGLTAARMDDVFLDVASRTDAAACAAELQAWVKAEHPSHPLASLSIVHVDSAVMAAGIDPSGPFSPEAASRPGVNDHCPDDDAKWFEWLGSASAVHILSWRSAETVGRDIAEGLRRGARVLVLHRIG